MYLRTKSITSSPRSTTLSHNPPSINAVIFFRTAKHNPWLILVSERSREELGSFTLWGVEKEKNWYEGEWSCSGLLKVVYEIRNDAQGKYLSLALHGKAASICLLGPGGRGRNWAAHGLLIDSRKACSRLQKLLSILQAS